MLALGFLAESGVEVEKNEYVSADSSQFSGLWYSQESDNFLEVSNGNAVFLQCTLREGYQNQQNLRYRIVEDELLLRSWRVGQLSVTGDTLTLTRGLENIKEYKIVQEIPDQCTGNAIEIKSVYPPTVDSTENSVLLVEIEYRLASSQQSQIEIGFGSNALYSIQLASPISNKKGKNIYEVNVTPQDYSSTEKSLFIVAQISEAERSYFWVPLVTDSAEVPVEY